jgi:hypothetical protein
MLSLATGALMVRARDQGLDQATSFLSLLVRCRTLDYNTIAVEFHDEFYE